MKVERIRHNWHENAGMRLERPEGSGDYVLLHFHMLLFLFHLKISYKFSFLFMILIGKSYNKQDGYNNKRNSKNYQRDQHRQSNSKHELSLCLFVFSFGK